MVYWCCIATRRASVDQVVADIGTASKAHAVGVLHHYGFKQRLESKGFAMANECQVVEICNPGRASQVLSVDVVLALPCRISICAHGGKTIVGMIPPTAALELLSADPRIEPAARKDEQAMQKIVKAAIPSHSRALPAAQASARKADGIRPQCIGPQPGLPGSQVCTSIGTSRGQARGPG